MKKLLILLVIILTGCAGGFEIPDVPYKEYIKEDNPVATIILESGDEIEIMLFPEIAPNTVNNFIYLSHSGFYNGLEFYQIIEDTLAISGDPNNNGSGGANYHIRGEFTDNGFDNPLKSYRGIIMMYHSTTINDSASSQFFILQNDFFDIDGYYAPFGGIIEGFDVFDEIMSVETTEGEPNEAIIIEKIIVDTNEVSYPAPDKIEAMPTTYDNPSLYQDEDNPVVRITFSNDLTLDVELFPEVAPITVLNFLDLVEDGFYTDIKMHRIIEDFMIQGGIDPTGETHDMIKGEFRTNLFDNPVSHIRGVISMARALHPNSASTQFFIVHKDSTYLNGEYAAFGYLVDGFDTLDTIASIETDADDYPLEAITIKSAVRIK